MRTKEQKKTYEMDMCSGSILKKMLIFTIPLMCSSILQLLFNAADIVVVGRFAGDNSLAAVGSNTALINLLTNLFVGLSIGANVAAARFYGAKQDGEVKKTVHTAMLLSIFSGIILTVIGVIGARQILIWMQTPSEVFRACGFVSAHLFCGNDRYDDLQLRQRAASGRGRYETPALLSVWRRLCQHRTESAVCDLLPYGCGGSGACNGDLRGDLRAARTALYDKREGKYPPGTAGTSYLSG